MLLHPDSVSINLNDSVSIDLSLVFHSKKSIYAIYRKKDICLKIQFEITQSSIKSYAISLFDC